MYIQNLTIELTRRCNLSCNHCLRGTAQNCDIDKKYIDATFKKFKNIGSLCLTGGEPSLVPELILYVVRQIKKNKVSVNSFDITTNAVKISSKFIMALIELYYVCEDKEFCSLSISNDAYHSDCIDKDLEENYKKLEVLKFVSRRQNNNNNYYHDRLINEGNGENYGGRDIDIYPITIDNENIYDTTTLYINVLGNVMGYCDLSYKSQDCEVLNIFNIIDDINVIKAVEEYNKNIESIIECCDSKNIKDIMDFYYSKKELKAA
jgi:organic radical activating enzyme